MHARAPVDVWRSVRSLPDFWRLLQVRVASQFGDGLFQAGLAGALLFNPDRAADPMAIAGAFAVLFLPYSLLGPFAGALMDRWDRRWVLVGANTGRLALIAGVGTILAVGAGDVPLLVGALVANGLARFVASGLSAALPHVVPREQVVTMNSVAIASGAVSAFLGANFMLLPRWLLGSGDEGASAIVFLVAIPVSIALLWSLRFGPRVLGPDDTERAIHGSAVYAVVTGWLHGARTVVQLPTVAAGLSGLAAHRMVVGINSLLILLLVRHVTARAVGGLGTALLFFAATGLGAFLANVLTPTAIRRWGRYATANGALAAAATIQVAAAGLLVPVMVVCGFLLGVAGQGGQAVRRFGDADGRRRRIARARVRRAGCTVLGLIHPLDYRGRSLDSRARARARICAVRVGDLPSRAGGAHHRRAPRPACDRSLGYKHAFPDELLPQEVVMADPGPFVADLRAESDDLDALVAHLPADRWADPTPAPGWTIAHQIGHLLWTDRVALTAVTDEAGFAELMTAAAANPAGFVDDAATELAAVSPAELLTDWRVTRGRLHEELLAVPDGRKLAWFGPPMSAASMATARLMETWAHGLDVADALGVIRPATQRLRSIAHLGVRTRDYAFIVNNLTPPAEPFLVELRGPSGDTWSWGPSDAAQRVTGSAEDFCFLVTQRRALSTLDVNAVGEDAQRWLTIAQAFAGPPGRGR